MRRIKWSGEMRRIYFFPLCSKQYLGIRYSTAGKAQVTLDGLPRIKDDNGAGQKKEEKQEEEEQ